MNEQPRAERIAKRRWPFPVIGIAVGMLAILSFPFLKFGCSAFVAIHRADSGFRKAKRTIDSEQLRSWALKEIENHSGTNVSSTEIPQSEIPDYIINLYSEPPEIASVSPKTSESEGCVAIIWGGGFFHWGFDIGPTNFLSDTNFEYRAFQWCPGIYYQHEAGWGLL